jgi:hypothetical protein
MTDKTIKQVIGEFKSVFGDLEYHATQAGTGLTVQSEGWKAQPTQRLEINADDYIRLAELKGGRVFDKGVISWLMTLAKGKR